jgi:molybdopterin converting factor small subunit
VAVNQEYARVGDVLKDGDEVALLPPVSGGFEESGRYAG